MTDLISEYTDGDLLASKTAYENVVDQFHFHDEGDGNVLVTVELDAVRWSELVDLSDLPEDWHEVSREVDHAFMNSLATIYGADDWELHDWENDDHEANLTFSWFLSLPGTTPLDEALEKVMGKVEQPAGPYGMHNALNGGFQSRNFYADAAAAFRTVTVEHEQKATVTPAIAPNPDADEPFKVEQRANVYLVWDIEEKRWRIDAATIDGHPLDGLDHPETLYGNGVTLTPEEQAIFDAADAAPLPTGEEIYHLLAEHLAPVVFKVGLAPSEAGVQVDKL